MVTAAGSCSLKKRKIADVAGEPGSGSKIVSAGNTQKQSLTPEERLARLGEAFLSSFDDDGHREAKKGQKDEGCLPGGSVGRATEAKVAKHDPQLHALEKKAAAASKDMNCSDSAKQRPKQTSSPSHAKPKTPGRSAPIKSTSLALAAPPPRHSPTVAQPGTSGDAEAAQRRLRQEWKLFMSSKPTDVLKDASGGGSSGLARPRDGARDGADAGASSQDFKAMKREVELLGAKGFEAKQRKAWHASTLEALGAKPPKRYKLPMTTAIGVRKNQLARELKAKEEAIATGMYIPKSKTARRMGGEGGSRADRGLKVGMGGRFVNGILMVKDPTESAARRPDIRLAPLRKKGRSSGKKGKPTGSKRR